MAFRLISTAFALLLNCLATSLLDLRHVDSEEPRGDADVDHVDGQAAQLAVGDELEDELLERDRVEDEVVAERVELEALLVDHGGAGGDGAGRPRAPSPGSCRSGRRRRAGGR